MRKVAETLREHLARSIALHETYLNDAARLEAYQRFVDVQIAYFLPQYEDLREPKGYADAIDYIVSDMVGPSIAVRDAQLAKVVPMMSRVLPTGALNALAVAVELNATILSINLDIEAALRDTLMQGRPVNERAYCEASRRAADLGDCLELIAMTRSAGESLQRIVRIPMIGSTLKMMRGPANMIGVRGLHDFLERGFRIFRMIDDVPAFLDIMEARMTAVFSRVFKTPLAELDTAPIEVRH